MNNDAVTTSPAPAPARVFHVGEIVRAEVPLAVEEGGFLVGEVVPVPASFEGTGRTLREFEEALADPATVWVQFRRRIRYPQPVPAGDLERLDVPLVTSTVLDLLAKAGIKVTRHEFGISDDVRALICDDDEPGEHASHARSLVLWFEAMDDVRALQELSYLGPFEFGCSWPSIYADLGLAASPTRPAVREPVIIRAVHLADLPTLGDLLLSELTGKFGGTEKGIRRRWLARSAIQGALLTVAINAIRVVLFHRPMGWLGWLSLAIAAVPLGVAFWSRYRHGSVPPRNHLDAVRRQSLRNRRGSGSR